MAESTRRPVSDYHPPQVTQRSLLARGATAAVGIWLVLSAFVWPHTSATFANTWIVGLGVFLTSVWTFRDPFARWVTVALGVWLFGFTIIAVHMSPAAIWNNALVACAVIALGVTPDQPRQRRASR